MEVKKQIIGLVLIAMIGVVHIGPREKFYLAERYNTVAEQTLESATEDLKINRLNIGGGWFLSKNVVMKLVNVNLQ